MVNAKYNTETSRSIGQMLVAYSNMGNAIRDVVATINNPRLAAACAEVHRAEIERQKSIARQVFEIYVQIVPVDIRKVAPLAGNRTMQEFERDLASKTV